MHFFSKNRKDIVTIDSNEALTSPVDQTLQKVQTQINRENMRQMQTQKRSMQV